MAVDAEGEERQLVRGLAQPQPLVVGPFVPGRVRLVGRFLGAQERDRAHELGRGERLGPLHERAQRDPGPRHRHRPGLDAAVAIETLLARQRPDQLVHVDGARLAHQARDLHRPGARLELVHGADHGVLLLRELVVVVVRRGDLLLGERAVEREPGIALRRVERLRRGRGRNGSAGGLPGRHDALRERAIGVRERSADGERDPRQAQGLQEPPPLEVDRLRRGFAPGDLPAARLLEVRGHGGFLPRRDQDSRPAPPA